MPCSLAAVAICTGTRRKPCFGEGPRAARVVLIGEQPGDQEDIQGHPFVGPAGKLLDRALADAGIDRADVYVTNAVKHFKFEERGKRRDTQEADPHGSASLLPLAGGGTTRDRPRGGRMFGRDGGAGGSGTETSAHGKPREVLLPFLGAAGDRYGSSLRDLESAGRKPKAGAVQGVRRGPRANSRLARLTQKTDRKLIAES
jgi:hypothetical protein